MRRTLVGSWSWHPVIFRSVTNTPIQLKCAHLLISITSPVSGSVDSAGILFKAKKPDQSRSCRQGRRKPISGNFPALPYPVTSSWGRLSLFPRKPYIQSSLQCLQPKMKLKAREERLGSLTGLEPEISLSLFLLQALLNEKPEIHLDI
ncbi:hypothetical protein VNO77_47116 [Canavalia gladiata]|uniref:Uncharacterized protein n=1 Tax=Canavalia gladiata TaxID=3824 RepID=A0AAN9PGA2_CANGL